MLGYLPQNVIFDLAQTADMYGNYAGHTYDR